MNYEQSTLLKLHKEMDLLPGTKIYYGLKSFNSSIYIFDKNYTDMKIVIDGITNGPKSFELFLPRNKDQLEIVLREFVRLFHNFIASASSLLHHTRKNYRKMFTENSFPEYQDRIDKDFKNNPLSVFMIKALRNYFQHYDIPPLGSQGVINKVEGGFEEIISIQLYRDDLLAYTGIPKLAKEFIIGQEESFELPSLLTEYYEIVISFHHWYRDKQNEIFKNELDEFFKKNEEYTMYKLNLDINSCLNRGADKNINIEDELFIGIFGSDEFAEVSSFEKKSPERYITAIEILEKYCKLKSGEKIKIIEIYKKYYS